MYLIITLSFLHLVDLTKDLGSSNLFLVNKSLTLHVVGLIVLQFLLLENFIHGEKDDMVD